MTARFARASTGSGSDVDASGSSGKIKAKITKQGYLARVGTHLSYPTVAVNARGHGAIAFSVGGDAFDPSTGYAALDDDGVGAIHIAGAGQLPRMGSPGTSSSAGKA